MRKRLKSPPKFELKSDCKLKLIKLERVYKLITPLIGGGVVAGEVDHTMPVRGTTIRGQLRYWWRACQWPRFGSVEEMLKAESDIWGSTSSRAEIEVAVVSCSKPKSVTLAELEAVNPAYLYGAFTLRPTHESEEGTLARIDEFVLSIQLPDEPEVIHACQAALWAWETFGGVGARKWCPRDQ